MVKLGGNNKHVKHVKTGKFKEIRGQILQNRDEIKIFSKQEKCTVLAKIGGITKSGQMTKKGHQKFYPMKRDFF